MNEITYNKEMVEEYLKEHKKYIQLMFSDNPQLSKLIDERKFGEALSLFNKYGAYYQNLLYLLIYSNISFLDKLDDVKFDMVPIESIDLSKTDAIAEFSLCKQLKSISFSVKQSDIISKLNNAWELPFRRCHDLVDVIFPTASEIDISDIDRIIERSSETDLRLKFLSSRYDTWFTIKGERFNMSDKVSNYLRDKKAERLANIAKVPKLYRIGNKDRMVVVTTYNKKLDKMNQTAKMKAGVSSNDSPAFFDNIQDAEKFRDKCVDIVNMRYPGTNLKLDVYEAKLTGNDDNFSLIRTTAGNCLVQSWKLNNIDQGCIIKKDVF